MMFEKCELIPCSRHSRTMSRYVSGRFCPFLAASKCRAAKRLDADEHLEAAGLGQQCHQVLLSGDLRIALDEELQPEPLLDHGLQQLRGLGVLVEVIRREHDALHAGRLGGAEAGQGGVDALAANPPPGDLDHRAEVARERAPAGRVQPEHRDDVAAQVLPAGRHDDRRLQFLLPSPVRAIDRSQLPPDRVLQDLPPNQLRLGQREAHTAAVQHRRVAGHHVGAADDRQAPVPPGIRREVQRAMELVALHAHQRQQRPAAPGPLEQGQVPQVGMDVFVDRVDFHLSAAQPGRRHAPHMRHGAVGHEPPPKTFHVAIRPVLAGLENHDSESISHGASLVPAAARLQRK